MYKITLENKKTKEVINYNDVADLNNGEKLFYKFQLNVSQLEDGEYTLSLYEDDNLILTDTLCVGDFSVSGLQYKKDEAIYIETKLPTKTEDKKITVTNIDTIVTPSEGYDAMTSVTIIAKPVFADGYRKGQTVGYNEGYGVGQEEGYNRGYDEGIAKGAEDGYDNGYNSGYEQGANEQKAKLTSIDITKNGTYTNEDGYNEVNVSVEGAINFSVIGYDSELSDELNGLINADIAYSKQISDAWNPNTPSALNFNASYPDVVYMPFVDASKKIYFSSTFNNCVKLTVFPLLDTSNVENMNEMFKGCATLTKVPLFNTSKVTTMNSMFEGCLKIKEVPQFDTSNVKSMNSMFYNCSVLETVPLFNTSKVTSMNSMFYSCKIKEVPQFDTSNVTSMNKMFNGCDALTSIPQFDTSNVTDISAMFQNCSKLERVPLLDAGKVTNISAMFGYGDLKNVTYFGGLKNLKIDWTSYGSPKYLPNLTYESVINILTNLYDFRGNGDSSTTRTIQLHSNHMAMLSDDDKAIATSKGWVITT